MTQQLVLKEVGFIYKSPILGGWGHSCLGPCSPTRPSTSLSPHQTTSQKHAPEFPVSLSVPKPATQTGLRPLWNVHLWVSESPSSHSSSLLQDLGYVVFSLPVVVQGSRRRVTLDHGGAQGGTRPKRVASPYVLQKSRSLHSWSGFSSDPSTSRESVLGLAGPHTTP